MIWRCHFGDQRFSWRRHFDCWCNGLVIGTTVSVIGSNGLVPKPLTRASQVVEQSILVVCLKIFTCYTKYLIIFYWKCFTCKILHLKIFYFKTNRAFCQLNILQNTLYVDKTLYWSFDMILEWNDLASVKVIKASRNSYNTYGQILESISWLQLSLHYCGFRCFWVQFSSV